MQNASEVLALIERYGTVQYNAGHAGRMGRLESEARFSARSLELFAQIRTALGGGDDEARVGEEVGRRGGS